MQYTTLGTSGLKVSRLCLGTMNFGAATSEKDAFYIMDAALDAGINFFDTANCYGNELKSNDPARYPGLTEEIVGRWFAQGGGRREKVVLATKSYSAMGNELDGPNDANGISAYKIRRSLEASLRRLQTDHIELYQVHHYDPACSFDELFDTYQALIGQGVIYYVGSCNYGARHVAYAKAAAERRHFQGFICEQHRYSLLCRAPELELLPAAKECGEGVIVYNPLHAGLLSGHVLDAQDNTRGLKLRKRMTESQRAQLMAFHELCQQMGEKDAEVATAWVAHNPYVTAPLVGPRTMEQLTSSLHALDVTFTDDALARLDELFPPVGKPGMAAPEAYAW